MSDSLLSDPRAVIARRDINSLTREKTIVLALLIQLFIAAFSSFLVVGLTSLYDPGSIEGGAVEVGVTGEAADELVQAASEVDGISAERFETKSAAMTQFNDGDVLAVVAANYERTGNGRRIAVVATVPEGSIRTTLVVVQMRSLLTQLERTERLERADHLDFVPLQLPDPVDASPYFSFTYTILIPLLLFLPPFISGSIAVDALTEEMERGTLELLRVAPVSLVDIVDGKAIGMVLIAPLQAGLWLLLLWVNGIGVRNPLALLALVTAVAAILVVLGLLLGLLMKRRRQAQLLYSVLALLLFGLAALLPEHPATTIAKLAVGSGTTLTIAQVIGFVGFAVVAYLVVRRFAGRVNPESLG